MSTKIGRNENLTAPKLYITDLSPFGARVRMVCAFTGLQFDEVPPPGGAGSESMKEISPFGRIPAVGFEEQILVESLPLMEYVVETSGDSRLMPETPQQRAAMRGLMLAHDHYVLGAIWPMFLQIRTGKPDPAICQAAFDAADEQYKVLSRLFGPGDFVTCGELTLADLAMAPFARLFGSLYPVFKSTSPFTVQPRLMRWYERISAIPEISTVYSRMDTAISRAFKTA
jgi:glutathione S-transferase